MSKEITKISPEIVIQNVDLKFDKNDIINIGIVEYETKLQEEFKSLKEAFPDTARKLCGAVSKLRLQIHGTDGGPGGEASQSMAEKALAKTVKGVLGKVGLKEGQYRVKYYAGLHESYDCRTGLGSLSEAIKAYGYKKIDMSDNGYACTQSGDYRTAPIVSYDHFHIPNVTVIVDQNEVLQIILFFSLEGSAAGLRLSAEQSIFVPASKKANVLFQNAKVLYESLRAMDARLVEVNDMLKNVPKLERQMKAAMAKKIIGSSPVGQELMKVMQEFNKEVQTKALPGGKP